MKNSNPFMELLKNDNIAKMKIDKDLIPVFKIVISRISEFFEKNNLLNAKDWHEIFEKMLLTNSDEQYKIQFVDSFTTEGGIFDKKNKIIGIDSRDKGNENALVYNLCHEFIHFLVSTTECYTYSVTDSFILDEGLTDYLTMQVLNREYGAVPYYKYAKIAKLYCELSGEEKAFSCFLNREYTYENENSYRQILMCSNFYYNHRDRLSLVKIQREIIDNLLDFQCIDSFDTLLSTVEKINNRLFYDPDYISQIYEKLVESYMFNNNLSSDFELKDTIINLCHIANKAFLYRNNDVFEIVIDDIVLAFDRNGNNYTNDFPQDGEEKGQIGFNPHDNTINIVHKDKEYTINIDETQFKNWATIYNNFLERTIELLNNKKRSNA